MTAPSVLLPVLLGAVDVLDARGDVRTVAITGVAQDTSDVGPGALFCCIQGNRFDGHELAGEAVDRGAIALLCERFVDVGVVQVKVATVRAAVGPVAAAFHGQPSRALQVVGITGTNGKTTTAHLVRSCLEAAGRRTGMLGSMGGGRTTAEAAPLQATLAELRDSGFDAVAMEVSSVGLDRQRVNGTWFAAGVFTNLAPDELKIHGTIDAYFEAKASLFAPERCAVGIVNADDEWGKQLLTRRSIPMRQFSIGDVSELETSARSSRFVWRGERVELPFPGRFNVVNAVAAATAAEALDVTPDVIARALTTVEPLAGHSDEVDCGQPFRVIIDYAHTGAALATVLDSVRETSQPDARVIVVFGAGGDRDPTRRALMGAAASQHADVAVVTSDNPRSEDPRAIIDAIVGGASGRAEVLIEEDRRTAIELALASARPGDAVVIAGKGHETGQIVGDTVLPFDDKQVATEVLRRRSETSR